MLPYITTESGFQTLVKNKSYSVEATHPYYDVLLNAVMDNKADEFLEYYSKENLVNKKFESTGVEVKVGSVLYNGEALHGTLVDRILDFTDQDFDTQPMINFLENLMLNPSSQSVQELYDFLEHQKLPITDDGCFLAYKSVTSDFKDKYTNTIDNSPGSIVEFERNKVDDDRTRECSFGLHVGALEYAGPDGWYNRAGDKVVIVKVNPKDAVSVPTGHNATKLRVCKYEVLSEYDEELPDTYYETHNTDNDTIHLDDESVVCLECNSLEDDCDCENCLECGFHELDCVCDFCSDCELDEFDCICDEEEDEYYSST